MDKKIAGLLGAVGALASLNGAQAATGPADPAAVLKAQTFADLLNPIPNAKATLNAVDAARFDFVPAPIRFVRVNGSRATTHSHASDAPHAPCHIPGAANVAVADNRSAAIAIPPKRFRNIEGTLFHRFDYRTSLSSGSDPNSEFAQLIVIDG